MFLGFKLIPLCIFQQCFHAEGNPVLIFMDTIHRVRKAIGRFQGSQTLPAQMDDFCWQDSGFHGRFLEVHQQTGQSIPQAEEPRLVPERPEGPPAADRAPQPPRRQQLAGAPGRLLGQLHMAPASQLRVTWAGYTVAL